MITIYHLSTSRSERIVWLMEELGLTYQLAELAHGPYVAGAQFTAADILMLFPFTTLRLFLEYDLAPYPNILAYVARIEARPAYQKAMGLACPEAKTS